jgi:hypothetical protein
MSNTHAQINAVVSQAFGTRANELVYNVGYHFTKKKKYWIYYEAGIMTLPRIENDRLLHALQGDGREYTYSFYGIYTAGYFFGGQLLRPGILVGSGLRKKERYADGLFTGYGPFTFTPILGCALQTGILTLQVSNMGAGMGINMFIRRGR